MKRTEFIKQFNRRSTSADQNAMLRALINCLDEREACEALDLSFEQDPYRREVLVQKICEDIAVEYRPYHRLLIKRLLTALFHYGGKEQSSCGYCLTMLYQVAPHRVQDRILTALITSPYLVTRKRAYKIIINREPHKRERYNKMLEYAWNSFQDEGCAAAIVESSSVLFLLSHFDALQAKVNGRYYPRLFLRCGLAAPERLSHLRDEDGITYCYVLAKLKIPLDMSEALRIFEQYMSDDRIGLLVWSFGKLGLWDALIHIDEQSEQVEFLRQQNLRATYGIAAEQNDGTMTT